MKAPDTSSNISHLNPPIPLQQTEGLLHWPHNTQPEQRDSCTCHTAPSPDSPDSPDYYPGLPNDNMKDANISSYISHLPPPPTLTILQTTAIQTPPPAKGNISTLALAMIGAASGLSGPHVRAVRATCPGRPGHMSGRAVRATCCLG